MSYTSDFVSVDIELLQISQSAPVRVEHERGSDDITSIVELLRLAGVDRRAFMPGARFHIKISYSYPS